MNLEMNLEVSLQVFDGSASVNFFQIIEYLMLVQIPLGMLDTSKCFCLRPTLSNRVGDPCARCIHSN